MDTNQQLLQWYASGETGLSSKHMAAIASGSKSGRNYHPCDPDDLNRCIKLVAAVPGVREHFPAIAATSKQWAAVIQHWDELVAMFHEEVGPDWSKRRSAGKTYERMKELGL